MISKISEGIKINVEVSYQKERSQPVCKEYLFAYKITIENYNSFAIRLLRCHWHVVDSSAKWQEMETEGIMGGGQPYIEAGNFKHYINWFGIASEIGKAYGYYIMENQFTKETFNVMIPQIDLIVPAKLN
jgi:ApaG protein